MYGIGTEKHLDKLKSYSASVTSASMYCGFRMWGWLRVQGTDNRTKKKMKSGETQKIRLNLGANKLYTDDKQMTNLVQIFIFSVRFGI